MVPAASGWVPRAPPYSGSRCFPSALRLRGSHPLRPAFPCRSAALPFFFCGPDYPLLRVRLASSGFAYATPGITFVLFFLRVLRCFTSPGSPPFRDASPLRDAGFPIRTPPDPRSPTAPRRVSPFDASFFSGTCLGIRRTPFLS